MREFREGISDASEGAQQADAAQQTVDEGYSSLEIAAESEVDKDEEPASEPDAAVPDLEAAAEEEAGKDEKRE